MIYIESPSRDAYFNLALEEYVFDHLDRTQEYFLLWQNENTIVVGKYQNTAEEINQDFVDRNNTTVARRLSGGGAVYHDKGNLNFTNIVDRKKNDDFNFEKFARPVMRAISRLGAKAEFTGRNDMLINRKKISGSSQYIKNNRILNHGCIMLDSNLENVNEALRPGDAKFESKSTKSVRSRVTTINENLPKPVTMEEFKRTILDEISKDDNISERKLTENDLKKIKEIRDGKYATWEWNYGRTKKYAYHKECKYDFGLVTVNADIERGIIKDVAIRGDFFGNGEIQDLERALIGERLDDSLDDMLDAKINVGDYISGMTSTALKKLLR